MKETKRQWYLQSIGIDIWQERDKEAILQKDNNQSTEKPIDELNWEELHARVANCQLCPLYKTRTNPVFGVGNPQANLMLIGEAPGANEDKQGEPFVGRAGKLLDEILRSIGLHRKDIFIANILKSRPPNNRDPKPEEVAACTPYLLRQMELIQPKLLVALGRISAHFLLNTNTALGRLRQQVHHYQANDIPLIVTYHPAYLLRNPRDKRKSFDDWLLINDKLKSL